RVLRVRDRDHTTAAGKANRWLDADHAIDVRWADDAAVSLRAQSDRGEIGRHRGRRARARAARIAIDGVRVVGQSAATRPAAGGGEGTAIRPLGKVGLPKNPRAAGP